MSKVGVKELALRAQRERGVVGPAPVRSGKMDRAQATKITGQINESAGRLCDLLAEAHEREAWRALGYASWAAYVDGELKVSRRHSYRLLNQARVISAIREAVGEGLAGYNKRAETYSRNDGVRPNGHTLPDEVLDDISESDAREIQEVEVVATKIRERVASGELPEDVVPHVVQTHRESPAPTQEPDPPGPPPDHEEPDVIAELERTSRELSAARDTIEVLKSNDIAKKYADLRESYARLEGRLSQEQSTRNAAETTAKRWVKLLSQIQKELKARSFDDIMEAIQDLRR